MSANDSVPDLGPTNETGPEAAAGRLRACADAGLLRHAIDPRHGGHGDGFQDLIAAHETLGRQTRDPGLILALSAHLWGAVFQVLRFGDDRQQQAWLPALLSGDCISGHAITEPQAGSDIAALRSQAEATATGYRLRGHKRYITNTPLADMMVVYARDAGQTSLSAFLVRRDDPGVEFRQGPATQGCATATMGDLLLHDCELPAERLLGRPGAGGIMIQLALEHERAFIFAGISGVMDWQLQQARDHARRRASGAGRLADHQAISHRIADMQLRLDTSRLWTRECARLLDQQRRITLASAQTKLYAGEAFLQTSLDAVHILGASGLVGELPALVLDAMADRLFSGSSEVQKNIIAAMLGLSGGGR
jgi:alkylation response protein AidB-like acyl-CoA dehydrogenase